MQLLMAGEEMGKTQGELYFNKAETQKQNQGPQRKMCPRTKTKVATQEQDKVAKENAKFKSNMGKKCKNPKYTRQETGAGTDTQTDTMNAQGVQGRHRLNTQTLMTRQGTGEEDQQVR